MFAARPAGLAILLACSLLNVSSAQAATRVSLELITERGFPMTSAQKWIDAIGKLGVSDVRIRSGTPGEKMSMEKGGSAAAPSVRITGLLRADGSLVLPGGKYTLNDLGSLRKWLDDLSEQGVESITEPRGAFGLLPRQLAEVNQDMKRQVDIATKGESLAAVIEKLRRRVEHPLNIDADAQRIIDAQKVIDDVQGLSAGTALAIMLRPAGLVMTPNRRPGGEIEFQIGKPRDGVENWPAGWKPQEQPRQILPTIYEFINVEIEDTPITDTLEALQGRLKIPFLYDHNGLALQGIDPSKVAATVPGKRLSYSMILGKVLTPAKLKYELRIDEASKIFLWISPIMAGA